MVVPQGERHPGGARSEAQRPALAPAEERALSAHQGFEGQHARAKPQGFSRIRGVSIAPVLVTDRVGVRLDGARRGSPGSMSARF